jgi:hypothetical protein
MAQYILTRFKAPKTFSNLGLVGGYQQEGESVCNNEIVVLGRPLIGERTKMAKTTKRSKRREWTKENMRELKAHSRSKTPVAEISKLTKRTEGALRQRAFQMGLSLGHQR